MAPLNQQRLQLNSDFYHIDFKMNFKATSPLSGFNQPFITAVLGFLLLQASAVAQDDWARWRGPEGNGVATADQTPPIKWTGDEDFVWKVKVPGKGHASPTIVGDQIFMATAEKAKGIQSVICFDRKTGQQQWQTPLNTEGGLRPKIHPSNTHASQTVATDRKSIFIVFEHHKEIELYCLSLSGEKLWSKVVGKYDPKYGFGYGTSCIIYDDKVIVSNENQTAGGLYAFNTATGKNVWKIDRGTTTSWSVPVVATVAGKNQLLMSGGKSVSSYNPDNGELAWTVPASWDVTCGTMVWDGDLVFASGGFPTKQTIGINAKTGEMIWTNRAKIYEQSMLVFDGHLFGVDEGGVAYCWQGSDGKEIWKERISRTQFKTSAAPLLANGHIYIPAENGQVAVLKANTEKYEPITTNKLGTAVFASFAVCHNQIYARYTDGKQGYLVCIGKK